jgi:hypothetical protein
MKKLFLSLALVLGLMLPSVAYAHPHHHGAHHHHQYHRYTKVWIPGHHVANGAFLQGHWEPKALNKDKRVIWIRGHLEGGRWISGRWTVIGTL